MIRSTSLTERELKFTRLVRQHGMTSFGLLVEEMRNGRYIFAYFKTLSKI